MFPGEVGVAFEGGAEGAEDYVAGEGGGQDAVDGNGRAQAFGNKGHGVVGEVEGGDGVQGRDVSAQPAGEEFGGEHLPREEDGEVFEMARGDGTAGGEGGIGAEVEAPMVDVREDEVVVAGKASGADEEGEVEDARAGGWLSTFHPCL